MPPKPAPSPPAPRLYLATPPIADAAGFASRLAELIGAADIAAVLVRLADADERSTVNRIKALARPVQDAGAALLLDGHIDLVARSGADGAHVSFGELAETLDRLKPDRIVGVGALHSRHDSMVAGETGADYLMFGEPEAHGDRPATDAIVERIEWWAELFEPPCVGYARTFDEAQLLASAGADFVMVEDLIWSAPNGPRAALEQVVQRLGQGHAEHAGKAAVRHG